MTPDARRLLREDVKPAEAYRQHPYFDCCGKPYRDCRCEPRGKLTIGYGRNLDDVGLSASEAEVLLEHDLYTAESQAIRAFPWFPTLTDIRQRAVTELIFNMGMGTFKGFRQTIAALKAGLYRAASEHLLDSKWKDDVGPTRSSRIARYLKDGA